MRPQVCVLSVVVPWPANSGGRTRTARLVEALRARYDVTLVAFTYDGLGHDPAPAGVRVLTVPYEPPPLHRALHSSDDTVVEAALEVLEDDSHEPWMSSYYESAAMAALLHGLADETWHAVLVEGSDLARYLDDLPQAPVVLDLMDVCAAMYARSGRAREAERVQRFERDAAKRAAAVLVVSADEADRARDLLAVHDALVVPNGVDTAAFSPGRSGVRGRLVFTGSMDYAPNVEAVDWFVREVLPLVRERCPDTHLRVVGTAPTEAVRSLEGPSVQVCGQVDDVAVELRAAAVAVVPVLSGGGTRLKVLEAAACGRGIVSTPLGAEGLGLRDGEHLLLRGDAAGFASAVADLLDDQALRQRLGGAARRVAETQDWTLVTRPLLAALEAW